jgi:hypothetical protein
LIKFLVFVDAFHVLYYRGENVGLVCLYSEMHLCKELTADVWTKVVRIRETKG